MQLTVRRAVLAGVLASLALSSPALANASKHRPAARHRHTHHHHAGARASWGRFSAWDEEWLKMSIEGDRFEIIGGRLAQSHTSTWFIKALGKKLAADHSKSLQEAVELANVLHIEVPSQPSPSQQWELEAISQLSNHPFDLWYSKLEVKDHMQDIEEATAEVEKGDNYYVRKLAKDELPTLHEHLKLAEQAYNASK